MGPFLAEPGRSHRLEPSGTIDFNCFNIWTIFVYLLLTPVGGLRLVSDSCHSLSLSRNQDPRSDNHSLVRSHSKLELLKPPCLITQQTGVFLVIYPLFNSLRKLGHCKRPWILFRIIYLWRYHINGLLTSPTLRPLTFGYKILNLVVRGVHSKHKIQWLCFPSRLFWRTTIRKAQRTGKDPAVLLVFCFINLGDRCLILSTILKELLVL